MRWGLMVAGMVAGFAVLSGCAGSPKAGTVGWEGRPVPENLAADVPFTSVDGRQTTLDQVREPVMILAFTEASGSQCCWIRPEMIAVSDRVWTLPITVAQVSLPSGKCPHGSGCIETCHLQDARLVSLCDQDRVAWKAYHEPKPGTTFLIDKDGKVVESAMIGHLEGLIDKARELGEKARVRGMVREY